jgi:hypothetical protein
MGKRKRLYTPGGDVWIDSDPDVDVDAELPSVEHLGPGIFVTKMSLTPSRTVTPDGEEISGSIIAFANLGGADHGAFFTESDLVSLRDALIRAISVVRGVTENPEPPPPGMYL